MTFKIAAFAARNLNEYVVLFWGIWDISIITRLKYFVHYRIPCLRCWGQSDHLPPTLGRLLLVVLAPTVRFSTQLLGISFWENSNPNSRLCFRIYFTFRTYLFVRCLTLTFGHNCVNYTYTKQRIRIIISVSPLLGDFGTGLGSESKEESLSQTRSRWQMSRTVVRVF